MTSGGTIPPIITDAITPEETAWPPTTSEAVPKKIGCFVYRSAHIHAHHTAYQSAQQNSHYRIVSGIKAAESVADQRVQSGKRRIDKENHQG